MYRRSATSRLVAPCATRLTTANSDSVSSGQWDEDRGPKLDGRIPRALAVVGPPATPRLIGTPNGLPGYAPNWVTGARQTTGSGGRGRGRLARHHQGPLILTL